VAAQGSRNVAARWFAHCHFDNPRGPVGSLLPAGVCYRALRRLPGQDLHLLEQRVFQDAPCPYYTL